MYYTVCAVVSVSLLLILPIPIIAHQTDMSFITALYFLVISLTTVGYGDIYPVNPAAEHESSTLFRMGFSFAIWIYMLIGISLIANLISLMQDLIAKVSSLCQHKVTLKRPIIDTA